MKKNLIDWSMKRIKALLVVLIGSTLAIASLYNFFAIEQFPLAEASLSEVTREEIHAPYSSPFENIILDARAVFVFDILENKVIFSRNENEKLPLASITKLMTAFVAKEKMGDNAVVTLTRDDIEAEGDSGLREGERWRVADLLNTMLIASSNDAARAVASFVGSEGQSIYTGDSVFARNHFVQMMNDKAQALGLTTMEFFNESGLDIVPQTKNGLPTEATARAGGYGSAREVALLLTTLREKYPSTFEITTHKDAQIVSQDGIVHTLTNTNEAIGNFLGLLASKTGYTDLAGGNLAILFDVGIGHPVIAVVLGSTYKGRFDDMKTLVQAVLLTFSI
ncbi:MAG: D-alanyl-D-alanine carboxypeptidase [Candidatus Yonathbacteria bacterium]|nr:D-alanyl-D-alanine carboxypeptidase [Candidatus Yonathbacteria bacterium]